MFTTCGYGKNKTQHHHKYLYLFDVSENLAKSDIKVV